MSFNLTTGSIVLMHFSTKISHVSFRNATFNINSTGAKSVDLGGRNSSTTTLSALGAVSLDNVLTVYDGSKYCLLARGLHYGDYGD